MNRRLYKFGLRLSQRAYVRQALEDRADLSAFREPPSFKIVMGMFLITLSFVGCWPLIVSLPGIALYFNDPWIAAGIAASGPVIYVMSHLCFIAGISLAGFEHMQIILRWAARKGVERLLSFGDVTQTPPQM